MDHEKDFRYLRDKYTDAGARTKFENICADLFRAKYGPRVHQIRACPGDDGIDVMIGDYSAPIENFQCKFFLDGIRDPQKAQIRESYRTACSQPSYTMKEWTLCIPWDPRWNGGANGKPMPRPNSAFPSPFSTAVCCCRC